MQSYIKTHLFEILPSFPDKTPPINKWLMQENIAKVRDNKFLLQMEYVALLVERFWL